ncbi:MAG TPA: D-tyrosyl-tRNA(Tyr) deacylase [Flavobacteriales bacterium]|jgi:D-aminoacyl-tRNA deacylase|nr:D-tyrosyl-tRNA(Tyr) deacylase [Flavobacteriales bacterium]HAW20227.1 D-tyrosyl-tRNA(Tyr) deacylase [Flavobacteriales bacterium]
MRVALQRVSRAKVSVDEVCIGSINNGLLVLAGFEKEDTADDLTWMASKILGLRIFSDSEGKMNNDIIEAGGNILIISQFTLFASYKKGNRPSFIHAAPPGESLKMYTDFCAAVSSRLGKKVETGQFGANMSIELVNDGPVTINMDSKTKM